MEKMKPQRKKTGYGNCRAAGKLWKNELHVFPQLPTALGKLGKKHAEFSTVPTAPTGS
jgi:hypothetical protein